ncbi:MAG: Flp pilus assembly protein CpaB [Planctomycetes bacterium]|nr:Flp pilus assembly protein CpaB [Planctomycetota bacterium]
MRPKSLILLALALGCGLIASIGISQVLDSKNKVAVLETVPIYVALQNINLGDPIDDGMVSLEEWPKSKVPLGAITKWEDLEDRRPRAVIFEGEPLMDGKLLNKGQRHDPIAGIPPGMRLKTVSVDARKSAAGLLSPGDRVDLQIFVHRNERENIMHPFTKILLQNIRVYAVDQTVQRTADGKESRTVSKTVSLLVTPQQANRITTAENLGEISLIPRHPDDDKIIQDWETDASDIFARSDANNREKERKASEKDDKGLLAMIQGGFNRTANEVDSAFKMKIIYPNEVAEVRFNDKTGERLDDSDGYQASGPGTVSVQRAPAPAVDGDSEAETQDADFPIDLNR